MKPRYSNPFRSTMQAIPMAALMLGAAEAGSTVGINISGDIYGYFAGAPVTAKAYGVEVADWQSTPISWGGSGYDYASTNGSMTVASLGVSWNCTNTWLTGGWAPPTPSPGDAEVRYGMFDNTGWSMTVANLNTKFPGGYVVGLIGGNKITATSEVSITENSGSTLVGSVTFNVLPGNYGWGSSATLTNDSITLNNDSRDVSNKNCGLSGLVITDKPVIAYNPSPALVDPGGTISLSATAIGIGTLTYQWKMGANDIPGANSPTYTKSSATAADSGDYTLVVTNSAGQATSAVAHITVAVPATVTWDADQGTPGAQAGSGTWNLASTSWWDGSADSAWVNRYFASFGSGASGLSTVTLGDDLTSSGLTFNGDYLLTTGSGKTLTLVDSPVVNTVANATLDVPLAGSTTLTKTGAGTLTITEKGTYSGPITIQQGTLSLPEQPPGYWYQWMLNTSVINLMPGTTLNCSGAAFGWYGNNNAQGVTINVDGALCQPNGAFGIAYNLKGGRIGTGTSRLDMGSSGGFSSYINSLASSTTSVVDPAGGILFRTDSGQTVFTFSTEAGTTPSGIDLDIKSGFWGGGSLVKTGAGTLRLSGSNSYGGSTTVNAGSLVISGQNTGGTTATVNAGSLVVNGQLNATTTTVNAGSLTVKGKLTGTGNIWLKDNTSLHVAAAGATPAITTTTDFSAGTDYLAPSGTNHFTFEGLTSTSVAPVRSANLYLDSPVVVHIDSLMPVVGQYPLMQFTGSFSSVNSVTLGTLPPGVTATLVNDTAGPTKSIYLDVTAVSVPSLVWKGNVSGTWDIGTTANWLDGVTPATFVENSITIFDDTADLTAVSLGTAVHPSSVTFDNSNKNYVLSGAGSVAGFTGLTKTGTGSLTLATDNTYTGPVSITGGTLAVGTGGTTGLLGGTGDITVSGATLAFNRSDAQTLSRKIVGTAGTLLKNGGNTLTMNAGNNTCDITIQSGVVAARGGSWDTSFAANRTITVNGGGTLDTVTHSLGGLGGATNVSAIVLNEDGIWKLNNEQYLPPTTTMTAGIINGPGEIRGGGTIATVAHATKSSVINSPVSLVGTITFNVADGAVANDLSVTGGITNSAALTKVGPGTMVITGNNIYTGGTNANGGVLSVSSIADAGGVGSIGTYSGTGYGAYLGIAYDGVFRYTGTGAETTTRYLWIDTGTETKTIDVVSPTGSITFNSTTGNINKPFRKTGAGTLTLVDGISPGSAVTVDGGRLNLSGVSSYTGSTTVNAGTLALASSGQLRFAVGNSGATNAISGNGTVLLDGSFQIDTSGVTDASGTWTLVQVGTLAETFGTTFSVAGFTDAGSNQWKKTEGAKTWTFDEATGALTLVTVAGYDSWVTQITNGKTGRLQDADDDGFTNLQEFLFGTDPMANTASLTTAERSGTTLVIRWKQRTSGAAYQLKESATLGNDWVNATGATIVNEGAASGDYQPRMATITLGSGKDFFRVEGVEN